MLDPTLRIKMFGGRTFLDLLDAGDLLPEHISAVICEAQAADAAYRRLGRSKAKPTNDWRCCYGHGQAPRLPAGSDWA